MPTPPTTSEIAEIANRTIVQPCSFSSICSSASRISAATFSTSKSSTRLCCRQRRFLRWAKSSPRLSVLGDLDHDHRHPVAAAVETLHGRQGDGRTLHLAPAPAVVDHVVADPFADADDLEAVVADPHPLADRFAAAEEILGQEVAEHHDPPLVAPDRGRRGSGPSRSRARRPPRSRRSCR